MRRLLTTIFTILILAANVSAAAIVTKTPERAAGQQHMLAYAAPAIDTVRVGFIGLGMRGVSAVERFLHIPGAKIAALCDIEP